VDCRNCHERWREDKIEGVCPNCGSRDLTEARAFNLMFKTHAGPVEDEGHVAYLRPETAQGMFLNFSNILNTTRKKPPFGIAQVGKSFRNEITPQNFVFRTREFEQMEMEYFVPPAESQQWFEYWLAERLRWYSDLGIPEDKLHLRHHDPAELSHYSRGTADVEFLFPWGWDELEGIANRGDFDLSAHAKASGERLDFFDPQTNERYVPHVICSPPTTRTRWAARCARSSACTGGWRPTRWRSSRCRRRSPSSRSPGRCSHAYSRISCATTTPPRGSASATGARTRWEPRGV
jgi:glycyl-tRNA synthetase